MIFVSLPTKHFLYKHKHWQRLALQPMSILPKKTLPPLKTKRASSCQKLWEHEKKSSQYNFASISNRSLILRGVEHFEGPLMSTTGDSAKLLEITGKALCFRFKKGVCSKNPTMSATWPDKLIVDSKTFDDFDTLLFYFKTWQYILIDPSVSGSVRWRN